MAGSILIIFLLLARAGFFGEEAKKFAEDVMTLAGLALVVTVVAIIILFLVRMFVPGMNVT